MIGFREIITCSMALSFFNLIGAAKFRICIVDGKGTFKRSQHYCPELDKPESKVECVVALDRLDCLRRVSKGTADFAVFSSEDLVTAQNAGIEILVTNELRYSKDDQEYDVVAIVDNSSGIKNKYDLQGKKYCHPGYGYETDWTRILANCFISLGAKKIDIISKRKFSIKKSSLYHQYRFRPPQSHSSNTSDNRLFRKK